LGSEGVLAKKDADPKMKNGQGIMMKSLFLLGVAPSYLQVANWIWPEFVKNAIETLDGYGSSTAVASSSPVGYVNSSGVFATLP